VGQGVQTGGWWGGKKKEKANDTQQQKKEKRKHWGGVRYQHRETRFEIKKGVGGWGEKENGGVVVKGGWLIYFGAQHPKGKKKACEGKHRVRDRLGAGWGFLGNGKSTEFVTRP